MRIIEEQTIFGVFQDKELLFDFNREYFFNSYTFHVNNHKGCQLLTFFLKKNTNVTAKIILVKEGNVLKSTSYSPFSFFEMTSLQAMKTLLQYILEWGKLNNIEQIVFKIPPSSYLNEYQKVYRLLDDFGFSTILKDINFYLSVNKESFRSKIARAERSKLNKCIKADFKFEETTLNEYVDIYDVLKICRDQKKYKISMKSEHLEKMITSFPNQYKLFVVKNNKKEIVAASVSIIVNTTTLYTFYWGDDLKYRKHSPVVFLLQGIYQYCQVNNIQLMDLGTTSINGVINEGSFAFKKHLGGIEEEKLMFSKVL